MVTIDRAFVFLILLWNFVYTSSYGLWVWRKGNRIGAAGIMLLALTVTALPIITLIIRG